MQRIEEYPGALLPVRAAARSLVLYMFREGREEGGRRKTMSFQEINREEGGRKAREAKKKEAKNRRRRKEGGGSQTSRWKTGSSPLVARNDSICCSILFAICHSPVSAFSLPLPLLLITVFAVMRSFTHWG
eukprot:749303-Hanusia_phi.AAC.2